MKYLFPVIFFFFGVYFVHSQEKKDFKIAVLIEHESPEFYLLLDQFNHEITALAGEAVNVLIPEEFVISTNYDTENAVSSYNKLLETDADVILVSGESVFNELKALQPFKKPTILTGFYDLELIGIDTEKTTSGIDNFSYVIISQTYEEDIITFKSLYDFKNLGIVLDKHIYDNVNPDLYAKPIFEKIGVDYKYIAYETSADILQNLE